MKELAQFWPLKTCLSAVKQIPIMRIVCLFLFSSLLITTAKADSFDDLANYMKSGNISGIAHLLNPSVELTLLENEGMYSRQQSEMMLKNFLNQHPPQSITIQHRGQSNLGAQYAIAVYESNGVKYRAYIFIKNSGNGMLIHELRIEKE